MDRLKRLTGAEFRDLWSHR